MSALGQLLPAATGSSMASCLIRLEAKSTRPLQGIRDTSHLVPDSAWSCDIQRMGYIMDGNQ